MPRISVKSALPVLGLVLVVLAAYANHFQNTFHFDDLYTVTGNVFIRDLHNIPRFFVDAGMMHTDPAAATYRPVTTASLAIDYWLAGGLEPFWFHFSTFVWLELQLVLMFFLFRSIMDRVDPHPSNVWTALAATVCYGLHPANAETVNYIVQRADLYNTLGVVASLLWFVAWPAQRKRGWYLIPAVLAFLAKAPALIFPLILLAYIFLFEQDAQRAKWKATLRAALPALAVTAAAAILTAKMTPAAFNPGAKSAWLYRLTQPWVALHYFKSFFLPTGLSADSDWPYVSGPFSGEALLGFLFVAALLAAVVYSWRRREARPIAFGLLWFVLALLPTSLMPLAEVTNDHRMFFPFVGLALAVFWSLRLVLFRQTERLATNPSWVRGTVACLAVVAAIAAAGTWQRNRVWRTEESLWHDVTVKSPKNTRGWTNYGAQFVAAGDYASSLPYFERALALSPDSAAVELNLGVAYAGMGRQDEAEAHFHRSLSLDTWPDQHYMIGNWLYSRGRTVEARAQLETAVQQNPRLFPARYLLMQIYSDQGSMAELDKLFQDTLRLTNDEEAVRRFREARAAYERNAASLNAGGGHPSPAALTLHAGQLCQAGKFEECLAEAQKAIDLRADYAEAYNNKAYALLAMQRLDEAIAALQEAVRLKPDYTVAKANLARALEQKRTGR
jgi:tetratricopeptide (TPR) repeat protein